MESKDCKFPGTLHAKSLLHKASESDAAFETQQAERFSMDENKIQIIWEHVSKGFIDKLIQSGNSETMQQRTLPVHSLLSNLEAAQKELGTASQH